MTTPQPPPDQAPIVVTGLSKTYTLGFLLNKRLAALSGLDLVVPKGSIYGLLGPNGAGKSTTIKILLNLVRPSAGTALVYGAPPGTRGITSRVGFVPENPAPYDYLTGTEFLQLSGHLAGLSGQELDRRVAEVLGQVDLAQAARLQVRRYSKGMVQRLALGHGLLAQPSLLVLDEPTSGLDPIGRRQVRDLILAQRDLGTTVLLCTHIIPDVEAVCDRIAILVGGKLRKEGSVRDLLDAEDEDVEVVVVGASEAVVAGLNPKLRRSLGDSELVRLAGGQAQRGLATLLTSGARIVSVNPVRRGVEDLFLSAVREAGHTVGAGEG